MEAKVVKPPIVTYTKDDWDSGPQRGIHLFLSVSSSCVIFINLLLVSWIFLLSAGFTASQ